MRDLRALRGVGRIHPWSSLFAGRQLLPAGPLRIPLARPLLPWSPRNLSKMRAQRSGSTIRGYASDDATIKVNGSCTRSSALFFQNGAKQVRDARRTSAGDGGD